MQVPRSGFYGLFGVEPPFPNRRQDNKVTKILSNSWSANTKTCLEEHASRVAQFGGKVLVPPTEGPI